MGFMLVLFVNLIGFGMCISRKRMGFDGVLYLEMKMVMGEW